MKAAYSITEISNWIGRESSLSNPTAPVSRLAIDSRKVLDPEGVIFFAISGSNHNGHRYIPDLIKRGVQNFVVSDRSWLSNENENFIYATDTVDALQTVSAHHRRSFDIPTLAITGSNGKTVVKEWLGRLLSRSFKVVKSPRSYNSQVGVPLSVWQMSEHHNLAIFEAGISQPHEMGTLQAVIQPTLGLFTNLRDAHSENFENNRQKAEEKALLFTSCHTILYCRDHVLVHETLTHKYADKTLLSWGQHSEAELQIETLSESFSGTTVVARYQDQQRTLHIPFTDSASVENALHCWLLLLHFGLNDEVIQEGMRQLTPVAMRLEIKRGAKGTRIINDVYNSDLGSIEIALEFLSRQQPGATKTLIVSDILQSDQPNEVLYRSLNTMIQEAGIERLIGIGPAISANRHVFSLSRNNFFPSTEAFLQAMSGMDFAHEMILIKGARSFRMERISQRLEEQTHETQLEIDLTALTHNLSAFRAHIGPSVKLMAVVKASSYGSGSAEVARLLEFHRVDYLAVAYIDEGIQLRQADIQLPILVLSPEVPGLENLIEYGLEPEVFSFRMLEALSKRLRETDPERLPYPIHINLDTGMKRLGFSRTQLSELIHEIQIRPELRVRSILSHLAASESEMHDAFTRRQIRQFDEMSHFMIEELGYPIDRHLVNSSGAGRFPEAHFDMVRIGIGLYGVAAQAKDWGLKEVASLKSHIIQLKHVDEGESVGYGRSEIATHPLQIATIALGYADGLSRKLGNRTGYVSVRGKKAPIVGEVCMDMCMIDVTGLDVREGDPVIVFGPEYSVQEVAQSLETIPYEVLTSIPDRVKRVYFQE